MKWNNYVGLCFEEGLKLVTDVDNASKVAKWDEGPALKMKGTAAKDLTFGLVANGYPAVVIQSPLELNNPKMKIISHGDRLELLGRFIDIFEDFLEEKGVGFPNSERDEIPGNTAIIYGTDYGNLSQNIEELLISAGMLEEENKDEK